MTPGPTAAPRVCEVALAGMRFHACVGILPHEREHAQPLELDLRVGVAAVAPIVVDYRALYATVRRVVETGPLEYLESLGTTIVADVLRIPGVTWARVSLRKPHVALGGPLDHAEVVIEGGR